MTSVQIELIRKSWRLLRHVDPQLIGGLFYDKLFTDHPSLRRLFKSTPDTQAAKLIDMLNALIFHLDDLESMTNDIKALAQRHLEYAVKPEHYHSVGVALLWTLEQGLGIDWTKEVELAWLTCYSKLADMMINISTPSLSDKIASE